MSLFTFGDMQEIVCTHLGTTYRFYPKANETFTMDKGGIRTNDDANQITSNGQMMRQLNRTRWSVEGPIAVDTIADTELTALNVLAASPTSGDWQFSLISGAIYKGTGSPVGDFQLDSNSGQLTLKVAGNYELEKI